MELVTWGQLATIAGAAAVVSVIVGFLKKLIRALTGFRTLLLVLCLSLAISVMAAQRTQQRPDYFLAVINGFVVAATAVGLREGQQEGLRQLKRRTAAGSVDAPGGQEGG